MARRNDRNVPKKRAAIYARVSDKSQAEEDKTSISEQMGDMEAYCEERGMAVVARYQEVGRGWSKKRPEFQRMLADARMGRFDTIVCWKSDRLSRGMYPAAALMEVVEAYRIGIEAVMDAIDMKTFGLMAAIGKIELDNFRERASMGKRGKAKQGRLPTGSPPYGYRVDEHGNPYVYEPEAKFIRRIFRQYADEGMTAPAIVLGLERDGAPLPPRCSKWRKERVHAIMSSETYRGTYWYGKSSWVTTEDGTKGTKNPKDTWIGIPFPPLVDEKTWERVKARKFKRFSHSKRNTKTFYLLQHMVRCAECGLYLHGRAQSKKSQYYNGKRYAYTLDPPHRYYRCGGMTSHKLECRRPGFIKAERLEEFVWGEVKRMLQNPGLIVAGIESLGSQEDDGWEKEIDRAERELNRVQSEEDRAIRLYVSAKITEAQLDHQRKFITERLETLRRELDDYRAQQAALAEKRILMENILAWASKVGDRLDEVPDEQRKDILKLLLDQVVIDGGNNVRFTLGIPAEDLVSVKYPESKFAIRHCQVFCFCAPQDIFNQSNASGFRLLVIHSLSGSITWRALMNVIWIVSDSFRRDHIGAYGNPHIRTPSLDALAAQSVRFDAHYAAGFPTMPTRADHQTGRWTMSFMGWEPLPRGVTTLAEILARNGLHTAASVDTPYYLRDGMNYDRGFQTFFMNTGQDTLWSLIPEPGYHNEALDIRDRWRSESDRNAPKTFMTAMQWLEKHYKEDFFLYVDTWDPHEPWDAPSYYTELYMPDHDGELVLPVYGNWHDVPGYTEAQLHKGHAAYCGEITMVDTWVGYLLKAVENMGLAEKTVVIFTSDHGFYFGEHGGLFGKMSSDMYPDGTLRPYDEPGSQWSYSPLFEEIVHLPLLMRVPGASPTVYGGLSSAIDVMPTVLDLLGMDIPDFVQGRSLAPAIADGKRSGRDFVISSIPFANPGDSVLSVDNFLRDLKDPPVTTVTAGKWSLLYSSDPGVSQLYNLESDPQQQHNVIGVHTDEARELHRYLVEFMRETGVPDRLLKPRLELRI